MLPWHARLAFIVPLAVSLAVGLAACGPSSTRGPDGPRSDDQSDCRAQASRQVAMRFPYPPRDVSHPQIDEILVRTDRSAAERRYFEECVKQKQLRWRSPDLPNLSDQEAPGPRGTHL